MNSERTRHSLLRNDKIRLDGDNRLAQSLDLLLLNLQNSIPVILLGNLDVGLRLALLVLKGAVEENDSGVLNAPAHLGMCDVLVEHKTVKNPTVLDLTAGYLLHSGISLDVDFSLAVTSLPCHSADSLKGEVAHLIHPSRNKLGANRRRDELVHGLVVVDIDRQRDLLDDLKGVFKGSLKGGNDDDRVDVTIELGKSLGENLTSCSDDVSDMLS